MSSGRLCPNGHEQADKTRYPKSAKALLVQAACHPDLP